MGEYHYDVVGSVAPVEAFTFVVACYRYRARLACITNHASVLFLRLVRLFLSAKYCGLKVKELINSTSNQVTVQFMSGTHHSGRGFYLSYSTTEHTGKLLSPVSQSWEDNEIRGC